jgi:hypothetical protein
LKGFGDNFLTQLMAFCTSTRYGLCSSNGMVEKKELPQDYIAKAYLAKMHKN